jgi:hypothetical protein
MRVRWAAAAGIAAVLAAIAIFLSGSDRRVAGTNTIAPFISIETVKRLQACQRVPHLPGGARFVRFEARTASGEIEAMRVVIGDRRGRLISEGGVRDVPDGEEVDVPLRPETKGASRALVCIYNRGREPIRLFGENKRPFKGADVSLWRQMIAMTFLEPEPSSWFARRDLIVDRYRLGHAGAIGEWELWLALLLALAASGLALRLVSVAALGEEARRLRRARSRGRGAAPPDA